MSEEHLNPPETYEPTEPEMFPCGVIAQSVPDGYELLLFGGPRSAQEAIDQARPAVIARSPLPVLDAAFLRVHGWYESYGYPPERVFPFTPPTTFVNFYSEDHPEVLR